MEQHKLNASQNPNRVLRHYAMNNIQYWRDYVLTKQGNWVALERGRDRIVKGVSFGLALEAAWPTIREVIEAYTPYIERCGHWEAWQRILQRAVEQAQCLDDLAAKATLSAWLARLLQRQGRFQAATRYYRQTIRSARQVDDGFSEARACSNLGYLYTEMGFWYRAEVLCCYALRRFEALENDHGRAHTYNHLGLLYTRQGLWDQAQTQLNHACQIWQTREDAFGLMGGYANLGVLYCEMRCLDQSIQYSEKALQQAERAAEAAIVGSIYLNIGNAHRLKGELNLAETYYVRAQRCFRQYSNSLGQAQVLDNLGLLYLDRQIWTEAASHLNAALQAWRDLNNHYGEILVLTYWMEYDLARGDIVAAQTRLEEIEALLIRHDQAKRFHHPRTRLDELRLKLQGG